MKKIIALAAALAVTPAASRTIELHDIWLMNCFPQDGAPFVVGVSGSSNQLAIKGKYAPPFQPHHQPPLGEPRHHGACQRPRP